MVVVVTCGFLIVQAAPSPSLSAIHQDDAVHVTGSGFPKNANVHVTVTWDAGIAHSAMRADNAGRFTKDVKVPSTFRGDVTVRAHAKTRFHDATAVAKISDTVKANQLTPGSIVAVAEQLVPGPKLFVSPTGNDANPGTQDSPVASIARARDILRVQRNNGKRVETTIYLRGGMYALASSLSLTADDAKSTYRSFPGEQATIIGGVPLRADQFGAVSDSAVLNRLPSQVRNRVREVKLAELGVSDIPVPPRAGQAIESGAVQHELFIGNQPMMLAKFPNSGFLRTSNASGGENQPIAFTAREAEGRTWKPDPGNMILGYPKYEWADASLHIANFDSQTGRVTTSDASPYGVKDSQPFYFFNILEELDAPGEFYIDRATKTLYVLPPQDWQQKEIQLSTLDKPIIETENASEVTFHNITVKSGRAEGISIANSTRVMVTHVTVQNVGGQGIVVYGGSSVGIKFVAISQAGQGGVDITGGDRNQLVSSGHYVEDSKIRAYSRIRHTYSPAISLSGVGNRASHNEISDAPHLGIVLHGNEHIVEYNNIHNIETESGDVGAIYLGRDWSEAGNIIRYNYIHDLGSDQYNNQIGIYLDDFASGTRVEGNIVARLDVGMLVGGGRNNTLNNNVAIESTYPLAFDARGTNWATAACTAPDGIMFLNLQKVPYSSPVWSEKYPWLSGIPKRQPCVPMDNVVSKNVFWSGHENTDEEALSGNTFSANWLTNANPGFVDAAKSNYQFVANAPAMKQVPGFRPPPFTEMGVRSQDRS